LLRFVIPAEAGIQGNSRFLNPGFHPRIQTFRGRLGDGPPLKPCTFVCVQKRQVCSAGVSPAMVKVRSHIAWMAGSEGNRYLEAHRQRHLKGDGELSGRSESKRIDGLENTNF